MACKTVFIAAKGIHKVECLSTDAKPIGLVQGSELYYTDIPNSPVFGFFGGEWVQIRIGGAGFVTDAMAGNETQMLTDATATGTTYSTQLAGAGLTAKCVYLATLGANNGVAATATVKVYGSRVAMASANAADKIELATLTLSGTGSTDNDTVVDTDSAAVAEHYYPYIWAEVTAISGAGAKVQGWRLV